LNLGVSMATTTMERYEVTFIKKAMENLDIVTAPNPGAASGLITSKHGLVHIKRIERLIISDRGVVTGSRTVYLEPKSQLRRLVQGIAEATANTSYAVLGVAMALAGLVGIIWLVKVIWMLV
jgi:hypothetical protein